MPEEVQTKETQKVFLVAPSFLIEEEFRFNLASLSTLSRCRRYNSRRQALAYVEALVIISQDGLMIHHFPPPL